ncbi:conserved hypothetical protein [Alteracholeplasma palmae J233]|uniref:DUF4194 domain-containing protein n=1 Tax=Alteracholeplasma palmae (strain ATCC 49389 / J233) TaxID=1318466 RepID=U4KKE4_ALTPJ|nr:DUF4194 domain-containing protein [Alteracholeplasma palmae]CCV64189.1 conserved hypothetical protein [Alteracholeplasma palmae J233]
MIGKTQAAKRFNEQYLELKEAEKSTFSRVVNKMFQVNYITRKKIGDANDYRFILAYKDIFEAFFAISDFELTIERHDEVVFIKNESIYNHLRLKKEESLMLLVIRVLFQRKRDLVTLDENVEIYLEEIHEELRRIGYLDDKRITKDKLKPALMLLRNYNIIDYIERGLKDDSRIKIYPTILYVTNIHNIKEAIERIDQYMEGSESIEETYED